MVGAEREPQVNQIYAAGTVGAGYRTMHQAEATARLLSAGHLPAVVVVRNDDHVMLSPLERLQMIDGGSATMRPYHLEDRVTSGSDVLLGRNDRDDAELDVRRVIDGPIRITEFQQH